MRLVDICKNCFYYVMCYAMKGVDLSIRHEGKGAVMRGNSFISNVINVVVVIISSGSPEVTGA